MPIDKQLPSLLLSTENAPLTEQQSALVRKLVSTNFKGFAEYRLTKLDPPVLYELARLSTKPEEAPPSKTEGQVALILEAKKKASKLARPPVLPTVHDPDAVPEAAPAIKVAPPAPPPIPAPASPRPLFASHHSITIVAFNSLKLRMDHEELQNEWKQAVREFATHDVLVLSEVRASENLYTERVLKLMAMLNSSGYDQWTHKVSKPSGPGVPETHVVFAKKPILITAVGTLASINGLSMDHAPIVATLKDERFMGELRRVNIVGVHFPPKSSKDRRAARDAQIAQLLKQYPLQAELRLNQPFTNQAARETQMMNNYVCHVVCGDFNADAGELRELGADANGWDIQLGSVRTSSGGMSYDNFLVSRDAKDHVTLGARVLDLTRYANFSRGKQGLSDHAPIVLHLTEVPRLASKPTFSAGGVRRVEG